MKLEVDSLDKAAFFYTYGGRMIAVNGRYPHNTFTMEVPGWLAAYEMSGGWVPYNRFCNMRRVIKRKARKRAGLPEYFTGNHDTGIKFGDIAMIRPLSKRDQERFGLKKDI